MKQYSGTLQGSLNIHTTKRLLDGGNGGSHLFTSRHIGTVESRFDTVLGRNFVKTAARVADIQNCNVGTSTCENISKYQTETTSSAREHGSLALERELDVSELVGD